MTIISKKLGDIASIGAIRNTDKIPITRDGINYSVNIAETEGAKLRRLANAAQAVGNEWDKPYMKAVEPWQPLTTYYANNLVVNGGNLYVCVSNSGVSASSGGPTITTGSAQTDSGVVWTYFGKNYVTNDPLSVQTNWIASTVYTLNQQVIEDNRVYACVAAGTSGSTAPTGLNNSVVDGSVTWTYVGVFRATAYTGIMPKVTTATTAAVSPFDNQYFVSRLDTFAALWANPFGDGSGYAVGDTVTLASGGSTVTTATVLQITAVASGVPTAVSVLTAGLYTTLQASAATWAQASTSGSGTGATFYVAFNEPSWCKMYNTSPIATHWSLGSYVASAYLAASGRAFHNWTMEFFTDSEKFALIGNFGLEKYAVTIDGVKYGLDSGSGVTNNTYSIFDFENCGGKKTRLIKITSNAQLMPSILVNRNASCWKPAVSDEVTAVCISDSIWAGSSYGPFVSGNSVAVRLGLELGLKNMVSLTQGGTGYINRGGGAGVTTDKFLFRIPQGLANNPDMWVIMGSTNDIGQSAGDISAAVVTLLTAIRSGGSIAPIVILGLWPLDNAGVSTTEAAVKAGVDTFADSLGKAFFVPIYNDPSFPWISGAWNNNPAPSGLSNPTALNYTAYISGDSVHPNDVGTAYLVERLKNAIMQYVLPDLQ